MEKPSSLAKAYRIPSRREYAVEYTRMLQNRQCCCHRYEAKSSGTFASPGSDSRPPQPECTRCGVSGFIYFLMKNPGIGVIGIRHAHVHTSDAFSNSGRMRLNGARKNSLFPVLGSCPAVPIAAENGGYEQDGPKRKVFAASQL